MPISLQNPAYSRAKPLPEYAKKVSQRPKLFHLVEDTRRRQFEKSKFVFNQRL